MRNRERRTVSEMSFGRSSFGMLLVFAGVLTASVLASPELLSTEPAEPITPIPLESKQLDPKRIALGERLFHDVRLSRDNSQSCATCHPLQKGGMDGLPRAAGADGDLPLRNTPTVFNVGLNSTYNWDGSANTLEKHADLTLSNPKLMNMTWSELLARLGADARYVTAFKAAYSQGLTQDAVLDAIAHFEQSLLTPNSRFDRYLRGEENTLTERELAGYRLFKSYGCASCHQGVNIGGNLFQKFGVFLDMKDNARTDDPGRIAVTGVSRDREVFRVPSLRNVAVTAPYFHDGRTQTLEEAVDTMANAQLGRKLSKEDVDKIVGFLHALTGEYQGRPLGARDSESR
jgi:cytochrome c peroxidase